MFDFRNGAIYYKCAMLVADHNWLWCFLLVSGDLG